MSLAAQAPDGTLHPLRKLLALLLVSVFTFSISGCGGGDASSDPEGESGGASDDLISQVEELISETEALMSEASAAEAEKYMASDFEAATKVLNRAKKVLMSHIHL